MVNIMDIVPPPEAFGCPEDWVYRDIPLTLEENWKILMDVLGDEIKVIISTERIHPEYGTRMRGQAFISPLGMERLVAFVEDRWK